MLEEIRSFPDNCKRLLAGKVDVPVSYKKIKNIIIAGMGGSAVAGDVLKDWLKDKAKIPVEVSRSFDLPAYADSNTLVVCSSYSGNTIETLEQFNQAKKKKCKIFGVLSGGKLEGLMKKSKLPYATLPKGLVPRACLPYSFFALYHLVKKIGLVKEDVAISFGFNKNAVENFAKKIAEEIKGTTPIAYSIYTSVATRFKNEVNEYAKNMSKCEVLPELNHNEIEGLNGLDENFSVIFFREISERKEIKKSIEYLKNIIKQKNVKCFEFFAEGKTNLERILYLIWVGDLIAYHLAILKNVDPIETELVAGLKKVI
jgi:glucose/mannose-6-phosphate isomerase